MIITLIGRLEDATGALFYAEHAQWYWDGQAMRPLNAAASEEAHG